MFLHDLKDMDDTPLLRLSIQRALLGAVTENLIAVTAAVKDSKIFIRAYFDKAATESELENISVVGGEVISDFPESFGIEEQVIFASRTDEMEMLDFWAFFRATE